MRLRRIAGADHEIEDRNNGHRHEKAFVKNIERNGLLHEADLLPDSYGGKFHPRAVPELLDSLPVILGALRRGKVTPSEGPPAPAQGAEGRQAHLPAGPREGRAVRAQPLRRGLRGRRRGGAGVKVAYWPGCVSRGFTPELHGSMAQGRPAARHRAGRARPRLLQRRRRDRRAQPGAGGHAERAHLRARPAGRGRRPDDEHLLDLPGRAERVPGAPRRQQRVPRARQPDAGEREPALREGHRQQALPVADGRGDRARRDPREGRAAADRPARGPVLRLLHRAADDPPGDRPRAPARPLPAASSSRRSAARWSTTPACTSAAASRSSP